MPSASTTRPFAASAAIESSLCERTIPESVQLAISSTWVRSMPLQLNVHLALRCSRRGAQGGAELLAGLEALGRIFCQRLFQKSDQPGQQLRPDGEDIVGRLVGDLEHELGHRFSLVRQPYR